MEVWSSTEMGAPGASHLGTGDHGPKTDRSRPLSVPVNAPAFANHFDGLSASRRMAPTKTDCHAVALTDRASRSTRVELLSH